MLPIHVISLAHADERRERVTTQLDDRHLKFAFLEAVDRAHLPQEQIDACDMRQFLLNTGREPAIGEIACFASHRKAWQLCVTQNQSILIMEDDFSLLEGFNDALLVTEKYIDRLGYMRLQTETRANKRHIHTEGEHKLWRYTKVPHSMACYAVSPAGAARLLRGSERMTGPSDVYIKMFWLHRQVIYGVTPYTVTESDLAVDSHIGGRAKAKKSLTTKIRRTLQRTGHLISRFVANQTLSDAKISTAPYKKPRHWRGS